MSATHTPGPYTLGSDDCPWTCGDARTAIELGEDLGHTEILTPLRAGDDPIAYLVWEPLAGEARQDELRATARLIAAAPELLAVVQQLIEWERDTDDPRSDIGGDVEAAARAACAIADNARSVLARCGL